METADEKSNNNKLNRKKDIKMKNRTLSNEGFGKKLKRIGAIGLAAATAVGLITGCGSNADNADAANTEAKDAKAVYRTLDEIKESGKVNIGVFSDKSPFGYVDENGDYQGYDVYFAERIGKDLGVDINYVSTEAASRVEYLETGKVDIILANFTVTEERAEKVDFALPYMNVALGVVSHDDKVITELVGAGVPLQLLHLALLDFLSGLGLSDLLLTFGEFGFFFLDFGVLFVGHSCLLGNVDGKTPSTTGAVDGVDTL